MRSLLSQLLATVRAGATARGAERLLWLGAAACWGVLVGLCIAAGDLIALAWAAFLWIGVGVLALVAAAGERTRALVAIALCAAALHMATGVAIGSVASTIAGGFVTGDDGSYYRLASQSLRYLQGAPLDLGYAPPLWGGDAYLFGAFVYLEIALFAVFGPDVRIPILLNGVLAVVTAIGIYDLTKLRFGHPAAFVAAAIVAFFPSLILWSALNLKDTLTTVLAVVAVWAAIRFQSRPRPASFALQFAAAEALITLRSYVAATMAIMAFLSISLAALPLRRRVGTSVLAGILTMVIGVQSLNAIGSGFGEQLLLAFERQRAVMAIGARTGFVPTPTPPVTSSPTPVGGSPEPSAPAASTPASSATAGPPTPAAARPDDLSAPPGRTLSYLPTGLAYAIFAPVPLFARRIQEILAAPEMVAWYVLVVAGAATLWRERRRWSELAPLVFAIGGLILVLALAEGNVGTLFRHRAMVIPFAASLASPSLVALWMRRRRTRTMATVSAAGSSVNAD